MRARPNATGRLYPRARWGVLAAGVAAAWLALYLLALALVLAYH